MEIQELRIGNLVTENKLSSRGRSLQGEFQVTISDLYYSNFLEPIPLTGKRLLEFGFEESNYAGGVFLKGNIAIDTSDYDFMINNQWMTGYELKYVHQLQNLFFALEGYELMLL